MLKSYLITLMEAITNINRITTIFIIIFIISCLILIFIIINGVLDANYKSKTPQYKFNIILDVIIPLIILFLPIMFFFYNLKIKKIEDILLLSIIFHSIFIIPLFYLWSRNRNWPKIKTSWKSPIIFFHISLGLLYPLVILIFFNILRYLRINEGLDLSYYYIHMFLGLPIILCLVFCWEFFFIWFLIINYIIKTTTDFFYKESILLIKSLHVHFLRYNCYFIVLEKIYKLSFIITAFIINHPLIYKKVPSSRIRVNIHKLYLNSWLIFIFLFSILFCEFIFLKGHITYSLFLFFLVIIIKYILKGFMNFSRSSWAYDCCLADFIAHKWEYPKYPVSFWRYFPDFYNEYDNTPMTVDFFILIETRRKSVVSNHNARLRLPLTIFNKNYKESFMFNTKIAYLRWSSVRWMHTNILHKATGFFARTLWDKIALLNMPSGWANNFDKIQQIEKRKSPLLSKEERLCYIDYEPIPLNVNKFGDIVEHNFFSNFCFLKKLGIKIFPYSLKCNYDIKSQPKPDVGLDFRESYVEFNKVIGIDQKAKTDPREFHCQVFSDVSEQKYHEMLVFFEQEIFFNISENPKKCLECSTILNKMKLYTTNPEKLIMYWAENLHVFPDFYIPPLRVPQNFSTTNIKPEFLLAIKKAGLKITKISEYLIVQKVPQNCDYKTAISLLENSEIQRLLNDN